MDSSESSSAKSKDERVANESCTSACSSTANDEIRNADNEDFIELINTGGGISTPPVAVTESMSSQSISNYMLGNIANIKTNNNNNNNSKSINNNKSCLVEEDDEYQKQAFSDNFASFIEQGLNLI